ncbi:MAG: MFS transporter [Caldimicrobium sp.]
MNSLKNNIIYLLLFFGLVSLLSDLTYEGARGILGPYLASLGANAAVIGFIAGLGEFFGYFLRLLFGFLIDKLKTYWTFIFLGYGINLFAVPALGLVDRWDLACLLIVLERAGKAIRTPARDTLLSLMSTKIGKGKIFGIHEALDQIGAIIGPLIVAFIVSLRGNYKEAFLFLFIPAFLALIILFATKRLSHHHLEFPKHRDPLSEKAYPKVFWLYVIAVALFGAAFVDFPLVGYHFEKALFLSKELIPLFYAIAMGVDALSALILGWFYDKRGFRVVLLANLLVLFATPFLFLGKNLFLILLGIILWGIGLGALESILRAVIAVILPVEKRGSGFGIFSALFGSFWFIGSFLLGLLYEYSLYGLILFSLILQALSLFLLVRVNKALS